MSFEDPTKGTNESSLAERGCTCTKDTEGRLKMGRHINDDCSFVRADQLRREEANRKIPNGW